MTRIKPYNVMLDIMQGMRKGVCNAERDMDIMKYHLLFKFPNLVEVLHGIQSYSIFYNNQRVDLEYIDFDKSTLHFQVDSDGTELSFHFDEFAKFLDDGDIMINLN